MPHVVEIAAAERTPSFGGHIEFGAVEIRIPQEEVDASFPTEPATGVEIKPSSCLQDALDHYVAMVMTASFGVALTSTFIKLASTGFSIFQIVMLRGAFCSLTMFALCYWRGYSLFEPREKIPWFILRGCLGAIAFACLVFATSKLTLSESAFLTNSYPAVTALLSWALGIEQLGGLSWVGISGTLAGTALIARPPFIFGGEQDWNTDRVFGIITAAGHNLFMSLVFILLRYMGKGTNTTVLTAYMHFFTVLVSIPFVAPHYSSLDSFSASSLLEWIGLTGACLSSLPAQMAFSRGFQLGPPSKTTSLYMTNILLTGAVGVVALNEPVSFLTLAGAVITLLSVILVITQTTVHPVAEDDVEPNSESPDRS